jgi:iron-sulfur cluster repair protein YtfE (RIC family)
MDPVKYLMDLHDSVRGHVRRFSGAGAADYDAKKKHFDAAVADTVMNVMGEERVLFPALQGRMDEARAGKIGSLIEEHQAANGMIAEIRRMAPESPEFEARATELFGILERHFAEEEATVFPEARRALDRDLDRLGAEMERLQRPMAA